MQPWSMPKCMATPKSRFSFLGDDMGDGGGDSHIRLGGMEYIHVLDFNRLPELMVFLLE